MQSKALHGLSAHLFWYSNNGNIAAKSMLGQISRRIIYRCDKSGLTKLIFYFILTINNFILSKGEYYDHFRTN